MVFSPIYNTNDDVSMARMASGTYDGIPNQRLVYIHPFYGFILSKLYALFPNIPWYGVASLVILALSLYCITRCIQSRYGTTLVAYVATLYIGSVYAVAVLFVQYTAIASLAGMSGCVALCCGAIAPRGAPRHSFALGAVLVVASLLLRENAFLYTAALALPLMLYALCTAPSKAQRRTLGMYLGGIVVLYVVLRASSAFVYAQSDDWKEYMHWSSVQAYYHAYDIVNYEKNKEYYSTLGWSENDYTMLTTWFYTDEQRFSTEAVAGVLTSALKKNLSREGVFFTLNTLAKQLSEYSLELLIFLEFQLFIFVSVVRKKGRLFAYGSLLVLGALLMLYLAFLGRQLPSRFVYPLLLTISIYGLYLFPQDSNNDTFSSKGIAILCAVPMIFFVVQWAAFARLNDVRIAQYAAILSSLPKGKLIFNWDSSLPMHWTSIFDTLHDYRERDIAGNGWPQRSPYDRALFAKYGIHDVYSDAVDNPNVYLVALPEYLEILKKYLAEHYHKEVRVIVDRSFDVRDDGLSPPLLHTAQLVRLQSVQR